MADQTTPTPAEIAAREAGRKIILRRRQQLWDWLNAISIEDRVKIDSTIRALLRGSQLGDEGLPPTKNITPRQRMIIANLLADYQFLEFSFEARWGERPSTTTEIR